MKRFSVLAVIFLGVVITLSSCDSGNESDSDLVLPEDIKAGFSEDNGPEVVAAAASLTTFSGTVAANLGVSPLGSNTVSGNTNIGGQTLTGTVSLLIDNTTGLPANAALVQGSGQAPVIASLAASSTPNNPAVSETDTGGNTITYRFDKDFNFVSASFSPGTSAGSLSPTKVTQVTALLNNTKSNLAQVKPLDGVDLTLADFAKAALDALAAGKTMRTSSTQIGEPTGRRGSIRLASFSNLGRQDDVPLILVKRNLACSDSSPTDPQCGSGGPPNVRAALAASVITGIGMLLKANPQGAS